MELEEGMTVADLGTGYFIPHLAEAVGEQGTVYAVDLEEEMLDYIEEPVPTQGEKTGDRTDPGSDIEVRG